MSLVSDERVEELLETERRYDKLRDLVVEIRKWMDADMGEWDARFIAKIDATLTKGKGLMTEPDLLLRVAEARVMIGLTLKRLGEINRDDEAGIRLVLGNALDRLHVSAPTKGQGRD